MHPKVKTISQLKLKGRMGVTDLTTNCTSWSSREDETFRHQVCC